MTSLLRAIRARPVPHFTRLPPRRFYAESVRRCPQCQAPLPTPLPVCNQCSFIQASPSKIPYHTLFQLPFEPNPFVVSPPDLKRRYLEAQKLCHPDGWASQGEVAQKTAEGLSNYIGRAFTTLKDPLPRAEYILGLHGLELAEDDQLEDMELIGEIMEIREEMEGASPDQLSDIADRNKEQMEEACKIIEKYVGEENWEEAKKATVRLKYLEGIQRAVKD